jgi:hypothetical protein
MIQNLRQYEITNSEKIKFEKALDKLEKDSDNNKQIHPLLLKAQKEALQSQLDEIQEEIEEYKKYYTNALLNPKETIGIFEENLSSLMQKIYYIEATVDHEEGREVMWTVDYGPSYRIDNVELTHEISRNGKTYPLGIEYDGQRARIKWHVQGNGVRRIAGLIVDYLGRGWIKANYTVTYSEYNEDKQKNNPSEDRPVPTGRTINMYGGNYVENMRDYIQGSNFTIVEKQNLTEAAEEIQQLLSQLSQTNPITDEAATEAIYQKIKSNPTLKARLQSALKAGGLEALKAIFNHPLFSIPAETIRGWLESAE